MTDKNDENRIIHPDELMKAVNSAIEDLANLHSRLVGKTQETGFALDTLRHTRDNYVTMVSNVGDFPEVQNAVSSAYYHVTAIDTEITHINSSLANPFNEIRGLTQSVTTACATSGSIAGTISPENGYIAEIPPFLQPNESNIVKSLSELDPALVDSYREIDQVLYATNADNLRASMMQARQVFDHFFNKLFSR